MHAAPGNPGMAAVATLHEVDPLDGDAVAALASSLDADLVVVGPEAPLVAGVADAVRAAGVACFGPSREAAQLEGSKAFAKQVMAAAEVPTALAHVCETPEQVAEALDAFGPPYVVKDDGLAAGKGVVVTDDRQEAVDHAASCGRVVIEEFLDGPEVSLFAITDGVTVLPLQPAQDFKRRSTATPAPTPAAWAPTRRCRGRRTTWSPTSRVACCVPTVDEMSPPRHPVPGPALRRARAHEPGCAGRRVQRPLRRPRDAAAARAARHPAVEPAARRRHRHASPRSACRAWKDASAVTVVIASENYPDTPRTGDVIDGIEVADAIEGVDVIHAGTARDADGRIVTAGGRVLGVTAVGDTLADARQRAYEGVEFIHVAGVAPQHRHRPGCQP